MCVRMRFDIGWLPSPPPFPPGNADVVFLTSEVCPSRTSVCLYGKADVFFYGFFLGGVGVGHDMPVFIARFEGLLFLLYVGYGVGWYGFFDD